MIQVTLRRVLELDSCSMEGSLLTFFRLGSSDFIVVLADFLMAVLVVFLVVSEERVGWSNRFDFLKL